MNAEPYNLKSCPFCGSSLRGRSSYTIETPPKAIFYCAHCYLRSDDKRRPKGLQGVNILLSVDGTVSPLRSCVMTAQEYVQALEMESAAKQRKPKPVNRKG